MGAADANAGTARTTGAQDDVVRVCPAQGQQQLDASPKRARLNPAVNGCGDMDALMDIDDFDAWCEEVDEERGSAWVEP